MRQVQQVVRNYARLARVWVKVAAACSTEIAAIFAIFAIAMDWIGSSLFPPFSLVIGPGLPAESVKGS